MKYTTLIDVVTTKSTEGKISQLLTRDKRQIASSKLVRANENEWIPNEFATVLEQLRTCIIMAIGVSEQYQEVELR